MLPVRLAFVHLRTGSGVYGQCLDTCFLQPFSNFIYIDRAGIPTKAGFYSYRQVGRRYNGFGKPHHQVYIFQDACACTFGYNFLHGTTEINIYKIGFYGFNDFSGERHRFFISTEDLDSYGALVIKNIKFLSGFNSISDEPFGGDKFGVHKISTVKFAKAPKGWIAHILHRSEEQRKVR